MEHRFRLKRGDWEIELAGERDFIEAQLAQWLPRFLGSEAPQASGAPGQAIAEPAPDELPRVSPSFTPKLNVDLAGLVQLKQATAPGDLLLVGAYYMEKYLRKDAYTPGELRTELETLPSWDCQNVDDQIELAVTQGYLDPLRDARYTLTFKGQNYVRDGLV